MNNNYGWNNQNEFSNNNNEYRYFSSFNNNMDMNKNMNMNMYHNMNQNRNLHNNKVIFLLMSLVVLSVFGFFGYRYYKSKQQPKVLIRSVSDMNSQKHLSNVDVELGSDIIAYIPLDDRPVNIDRVKYLTGSIGYRVTTPNRNDYSTKMDDTIDANTSIIANDTSVVGNPRNLADFLLAMEKEGCNYYVISLDQLFSGGLVGSRYFLDSDFGDANIQYAMSTLAQIVSKQENRVYLYDSVVRLASNIGFKGYTSEEYNFFRVYGSIGRNKISDGNLSIDSIYHNYAIPAGEYDTVFGRFRYEVKGSRYELTNVATGTKYSVSNSQFDRFLLVRRRKLDLFTKYINYLGNNDNVVFLMGTDDTVSNTNNIQENEIRYITNLARNYNSNFEVKSGTDEMGMLMFTRLAVDVSNAKIKLGVSYYGDDRTSIASDFDTNSVEGTIKEMVDTINVELVDRSNPDVNVDLLVYSCKNNCSTTAYKEMVDQYKKNIESGRLTIIIDNGEGIAKDAAYNNFDYLVSEVPLGYLLGYSRWNTYGNASGIAISQGITRYLYLVSPEETANADANFLKSITFDYVKDYGYKQFVNAKYSTSDINIIMNSDSNSHVPSIINNLENSNYVSKLQSNGKIVYKGISNVDVSNYTYPWNRAFELTFVIDVSSKDSLNQFVAQEKDDDYTTQDNQSQPQPQPEPEQKEKSEDSVDNSNNNNNNNNSNSQPQQQTKPEETKENDQPQTPSTPTPKETVNFYAYITPGGSFGYTDFISRAEYAKWLCLSTNVAPVTSYKKVFTDVTTNTSNWQYIIAAYNAGYIVGDGTSAFRPYDNTTRAEAISGINKLSDKLNIKYDKTCVVKMPDVASNVWYYNDMSKAASRCIIEGDENGKYNPTAKITKVELAAIIYRAEKRNPSGWSCSRDNSNPFSNVSTSYWGYEYLLDATRTYTCTR